ncbi:Hypothetical Protein FCC1311_086402, partial [Hondaea fermentalgiana]
MESHPTITANDGTLERETNLPYRAKKRPRLERARHGGIVEAARMLLGAAASPEATPTSVDDRARALRPSALAGPAAVKALELAPLQDARLLVSLVEALQRSDIMRTERAIRLLLDRPDVTIVNLVSSILKGNPDSSTWAVLVDARGAVDENSPQQLARSALEAVQARLADADVTPHEVAKGLDILRLSLRDPPRPGFAQTLLENFLETACKPFCWFLENLERGARQVGNALIAQALLLSRFGAVLGSSVLINVCLALETGVHAARTNSTTALTKTKSVSSPRLDILTLYFVVHADREHGPAYARECACRLAGEAFELGTSPKERVVKLVLASHLAQIAAISCTTPVSADAPTYRAWFRENLLNRLRVKTLRTDLAQLDKDIYSAWKRIAPYQSVEAIREHVLVIHKKRTRLSNNATQSKALIAYLRDALAFLGIKQDSFRAHASDVNTRNQSRTSHELASLFIREEMIHAPQYSSNNNSREPSNKLLVLADAYPVLVKNWVVSSLLGSLRYPTWLQDAARAGDAHLRILSALAQETMHATSASSGTRNSSAMPLVSRDNFYTWTSKRGSEVDAQELPGLVNGLVSCFGAWPPTFQQLFLAEAAAAWPALVAKIKARTCASLKLSTTLIDEYDIMVAADLTFAWPQDDPGRRDQIVNGLVRLLVARGPSSQDMMIRILQLWSRQGCTAPLQTLAQAFFWLQERRAFLQGETSKPRTSVATDPSQPGVANFANACVPPPLSTWVRWEALISGIGIHGDDNSGNKDVGDFSAVCCWTDAARRAWFPSSSPAALLAALLEEASLAVAPAPAAAPSLVLDLAGRHLTSQDLARCLRVTVDALLLQSSSSPSSSAVLRVASAALAPPLERLAARDPPPRAGSGPANGDRQGRHAGAAAQSRFAGEDDWRLHARALEAAAREATREPSARRLARA